MSFPLQTQIFLRQNGLAALCEKFALKAVRHERFSQLVLLKYNQIFSPMSEPIVQECRGLILDENSDWAVVSHPFDKFFNAAESNAAPIDWKSARVYEKLDGSLMSLYHYDGAWQVASSGTPDASGSMGTRAGKTMAQTFWKIWHDLGLQLPPAEFVGWWFGFEFMTPWNQVVVRHETSKIVAIGARGADGNEIWPTDLPFGWPLASSFPLASLEDALHAAEQIPTAQGEGFVVCDANFRRVKIKSPGYVALHHLRDQVSPPRLLELVRSGEGDEFLAYFPDFAAQFQEVRARYDALIADVEADFEAIRAIEAQRDFAEAANKTTFPAALFALRNGKTGSAREFFANVHLASLLSRLGLRETGAEPTLD